MNNQSPDQPGPGAGRPQAHRKIMLVEDNPLDLELTLRAFKLCGVSKPVIVARDGQEALEIVEAWAPGSTTPDLILLDLNLPKLSGLEVLEVLKSHAHHRRIPVIVLTSSSSDRDIKSAYALGANSYIVKPVDYDHFINMVRTLDTYWNIYSVAPVQEWN